jgi:hypothetical protein
MLIAEKINLMHGDAMIDQQLNIEIHYDVHVYYCLSGVCAFIKSLLLVIPQQGLLQSDPEGEHNEQLGFYGRCQNHATIDHSHRVNPENKCLRSNGWTCARTEVIWLELIYCPKK